MEGKLKRLPLLARGRVTAVVCERFMAVVRGLVSSTSEGGGSGGFASGTAGVERILGNEVKRGRMYENVDGGGGGGGLGGRGGGNQVWSDKRARSEVTCRLCVRSAFAPTM